MAIMGSFVPISALLFCLALTTIQVWLTHRRGDSFGVAPCAKRANYGWVVICLLGLVAAILGAIAIGFLSIALFRLDVLQNGQHGGVAFIIMVAVFTVMMTLSQWIILRRKVNTPALQAALNATLGTFTWLLFVSRLLEYENAVLGLLLFAILSVVLGGGLGGIIHKILNQSTD
jgi:hypothetical protein